MQVLFSGGTVRVVDSYKFAIGMRRDKHGLVNLCIRCCISIFVVLMLFSSML